MHRHDQGEGFVVYGVDRVKHLTFRNEATRKEEQHYGPTGNKRVAPPRVVHQQWQKFELEITRLYTREANKIRKRAFITVASERKENLGPNFLGPKGNNRRILQPKTRELETSPVGDRKGRKAMDKDTRKQSRGCCSTESDDGDMSIIQTEERTVGDTNKGMQSERKRMEKAQSRYLTT
ncbi:hypothetical protein H5410_036335 [Solanum commersonii]|uniref:Uncharacterized protein n=1 Tax=Solanum commersonii TaxID=4109 RepID=A0A9J5Y5C0_SOLCO|nr:hypothetical protein H5410_036335 [Solanum commersonii]